MDELEQLLAEEEKETPTTPSDSEPDGKEEKEKETKKEDEEALKKEEHLAKIQRAIEEANVILKSKREDIKKAKATPQQLEDDDIPEIDMSDPSSKAWNRRINQSVQPVQEELEKEKEEIRSFALKEFLTDKPSLVKNPEKVKELVATYKRIRTATERTKEGVLLDLQRAYAAIYSDELLQAAKQKRVDEARADSVFSDIAVSKGATAYQNKTQPKNDTPQTDEERDIVKQWDKSLDGMGFKNR